MILNGDAELTGLVSCLGANLAAAWSSPVASFLETSVPFVDVCFFIPNLCSCLQSKMKKIQEKYGDQDEEERELRLQLLAVITLSQSVDQFIRFCGRPA